jgi:hypothetical protein
MEHDKLKDKKMEFGAAKPAAPADSEIVSAIVKVKVPNYVPKGFTVRSRVDETMFTADCNGSALRSAQEDPNVESVALSKRLRLQKS